MNKQHITQQFDNELGDIRGKLLKMGGMVEDMMRAAIDGFSTGNTAQLNAVLEQERQVNAF